MFGLLSLAATYLIPLLGDAVGSLFSDSAQPAAKAVTTAVAQTAIDTAAKLTGIQINDESSMQQAAKALQADPAMLADYQRALNEQALGAMKEETARLQIVNDTIRAEAQSNDPFVRRMRPFFGYVMAVTWGVQMGAASWVIVSHPEQAASVLNGIASTTTLWGIGLAVLGVYVYKRSQEKGVPGSVTDLVSSVLPGRKPTR